MEPDERPSVHEHAFELRQLERAITFLLGRIDAGISADSGDLVIVGAIRNSVARLSVTTGYEELSRSLDMGLDAFSEGRRGRAKVRLVEALHLVVHSPGGLFNRNVSKSP